MHATAPRSHGNALGGLNGGTTASWTFVAAPDPTKRSCARTQAAELLPDNAGTGVGTGVRCPRPALRNYPWVFVAVTLVTPEGS